MHRAQVITVERRLRRSWADKQQIVDETLIPGASISAVPRRNGRTRRLVQSGAGGRYRGAAGLRVVRLPSLRL
jgi:transposase-like protein